MKLFNHSRYDSLNPLRLSGVTPDEEVARILEAKMARVRPPEHVQLHRDVVQERIPWILRKQAS